MKGNSKDKISFLYKVGKEYFLALFVIYFLKRKRQTGMNSHMKENSCFFMLTMVFLSARLFNVKSE